MVLDSATGLSEADQLTAESWASLWLGEAWRRGEVDSEAAVRDFLAEVCSSAVTQINPDTVAALRAFRLVAPASSYGVLDAGLAAVSAGASNAETDAWDPGVWTITDAARYLDPWDCERFFMISLNGPLPHCLLVAVDPSVRAIQFLKVMDLSHAGDFFADWPDDLPPVRRDDSPPADVLAEAANALRQTDAVWPREVSDDTAAHRALAWSRCRLYLRGGFPERASLTPEELEAVIASFLGRAAGDDQESFCAELILDFGEGYMNDPFAWSPHWVARFLLDHVPNRLPNLSDDDAAVLPDVLGRWVAFALERRGVPTHWITLVVEAVEQLRDPFEELRAESSLPQPTTED